MNRTQLEHVIRAAAAITGADEFVVIGSQAILAQHPDPPQELLVSVEADLFSTRNPGDAELIDGSIGEASPFHRTFGYYAHGVGEQTAVLPEGWRERLVPLKSPGTGGATGLCVEAHDLAVSKLIAGRPKDLDYIATMLLHRIVDPDVIRQRIKRTPIDASMQDLCRARLSRASSV